MSGIVNQPAFIDLPRPQRRTLQVGGVDVLVTDGGTGRSSHTDGGLLIGKGAAAIENTGEMADSEMVVGDGTTNPVLESGDTLRISIGVGSTDSPRFTGIELGAASDNTLTRASAGDMNIEGNIVYRAGGTDVALADGGSGASDAAGARSTFEIANHDSIVVSAAGEAINTEQPAFLATPSSALTDVTGDDTNYTVVFATEIFDQNADFDATSTFTASVTGRYDLATGIRMTGILSTHTLVQISIVTSNRTYLIGEGSAFGMMSVGTGLTIASKILADMDAADTATVLLDIANGTKVIDLDNGSTFFSGQLST